jgi:GT2 family glycosyltransferase
MEPLTTIVVTYNRLEYSKRTIDSLRKTTPNAEIIVYDNHSTEAGFYEWLLQDGFKHPHQVIMNDKNDGWGKAVNDALRFSNTEYILVSNNDVIYHDGWYEKCLQAYKDNLKLGILGVWKHPAHGVLETRGNLVIKDQMPAVGWLLKRSVINDIGAFKENGPANMKGGNGEDVDYCIRTREKGYMVAGLLEDVGKHIDGE